MRPLPRSAYWHRDWQYKRYPQHNLNLRLAPRMVPLCTVRRSLDSPTRTRSQAQAAATAQVAPVPGRRSKSRLLRLPPPLPVPASLKTPSPRERGCWRDSTGTPRARPRLRSATAAVVRVALPAGMPAPGPGGGRARRGLWMSLGSPGAPLSVPGPPQLQARQGRASAASGTPRRGGMPTMLIRFGG